MQNHLLCSCHNYHLQSKEASSTRGSESFLSNPDALHTTLTSMINVYPCNADLCSSLNSCEPSWDRRCRRSKIIVETNQMQMERFQKTKTIRALSSGRAGWKRRGWPSWVGKPSFPLWLWILEVEVVFPDVGDILEQVLHAAPGLWAHSTVCGADLVLHWLPGQVDLVLVSLQDGRVQDISLGVMPCSQVTH